MNDNDQRQAMALRLREARRLSGLSQGQVAQQMKLHRPSITEVESGKRRVSAEELKRFAELYDVSISYLVGEAPETLDLDDPRIRLAARELKKLPPESLDRLLQVLAALREDDEGKQS
jgi:transcriptional regulator with XRE-family HTH domain